MKTKIIVGVVAVVVAGGIFFGGMKYGQAKTTQGTGNRFAQFQNGQMGGANAPFGARGQGATNMRMNGGLVAGEILSKDDTSITVKLQNGGSRIVFTSASTTVLKSTTGSMADLSSGTNVSVQGTTNADGSVTAQSIQVRPR